MVHVGATCTMTQALYLSGIKEGYGTRVHVLQEFPPRRSLHNAIARNTADNDEIL